MGKNILHNAFVAHLNINSIQNKFEKLKLLNDPLKAQILIVSKTKINHSYPDNQFRLKGYSMYHRDRTKGGGEAHCLFLYIHSVKEIKIAQDQKEAGS